MSEQLMCAKCGLLLRVAKVGVAVVRTAYDTSVPYTEHSGDLLNCPGCGTQVVMYNSRGRNLTGDDTEAIECRARLAYVIAGGEHVYVEFETIAKARARNGYSLLQALTRKPQF